MPLHPKYISRSVQLYAYYKIATVSVTPQNSRPGIFDFQGRAKWDVWKRLGDSLKSNNAQTLAETRYVQLCEEKLGFNSEAGAPLSSPRNQRNDNHKEKSADELLDEDDDLENVRNDRQGASTTGMAAVSTMQLDEGHGAQETRR